MNPISEDPPESNLESKKEVSFVQTNKLLHLAYWLIIIILIWNIVILNRETSRLDNWLEQVQNKVTDQLLQAKKIQQKIEGNSKEMGGWQKQTEKSLQNIQTKTSYIKSMSIQEHYFKKVENIKQLSQNQQIFKKEERKANVSFLLSMNNFKLVHLNIKLKREIDSLLKEEYERLSKQHDFTLPELPFCIVVPTYNNAQNFRYEYNLYSIFNQDYTNFKVVIIDDASIDHNFQLISQFVEDHPIPQKVILHRNSQRMTTVYSIYKAVTDYCDNDDIVILVDGDDELLGVNIFKVFNSVYTKKNLDVLYSNLIVNEKNADLKRGFSSAYTEEEKKLMKYREGDTRMFPLRSFKVSTFLKIRVNDLKDDKGDWFRCAYDQCIMPQLLELSCGKNEYIEQFFYLYNFGLGNNDMEVDLNLNEEIMKQVRFKRKKYECPVE